MRHATCTWLDDRRVVLFSGKAVRNLGSHTISAVSYIKAGATPRSVRINIQRAVCSRSSRRSLAWPVGGGQERGGEMTGRNGPEWRIVNTLGWLFIIVWIIVNFSKKKNSLSERSTLKKYSILTSELFKEVFWSRDINDFWDVVKKTKNILTQMFYKSLIDVLEIYKNKLKNR